MPLIFINIDQYELTYILKMALIHTFPFVFCAINLLLLSDAVVYYSDVWLILVVAVAYLPLTYLFTKRTGLLVYYFLTWQDGDVISFWFPIAAVFTGVESHIIFAILT